MTYSRKNSVLWKEAVKMSDMAVYKAPNNLKMGLSAFGDELKRLLVIGIIVPLLLMIPSIYMPSRWVKYDRIIDTYVTGEYSEDPFSDMTADESDFINEMENGMSQYELKVGMSFAAFILMAFLVVLNIGNLIKTFFGTQAEMTFGVPCKKSVLFVVKFVSSMLIMVLAFVLFTVQTALTESGIVFRNGGFYEIIGSYQSEWTDSQVRLIRSYEPVKFGGFTLHLLIMVVWLGLAFLLALIGKLQKHLSTPLCTLCIVIATVIVLFISVAAIAYGDSYNNLPLMLSAPVLLLVADVLLISKYDRVSS